MDRIKGIVAATITPMRGDESIDYDALETIINWQINQGIHGICVVNSVGEYYALSEQELLTLFRETVQIVRHRVPVYLGTTANSTRQAIRYAKAAESSGADFLSVAPPVYIHPNEKELFQHFSQIAKSVNIPLVLYNNPDLSHNALTTALVKKLSTDKNIVGIKDGSGKLNQVLEYINNSPDDFSVLAGTSGLLYESLCNGAEGAIASVANIAPKLLVDLYNAVCSSNHEEAKRLSEVICQISKAYKSGLSFPANVKACCNVIGLPAGPTRRPIGSANADQKEMIEKIFRDNKLEFFNHGPSN